MIRRTRIWSAESILISSITEKQSTTPYRVRNIEQIPAALHRK